MHDIKRVSLTHFAKTGPSVKEFMARSGHTSVTAAARYLDASDERDAEPAAKADALLDGTGF